MSVPTLFFHEDALGAAFMQSVSRALNEQHIDQAEHTWLEAQLTTATESGSARIDLLGVDDGSDPPALTGTLMFSDPGSPSRRVFLYGPVFGLEVFDDRAGVDETLRHRITSHSSTLEATRVQGDVFAAQMNNYLSQRASRLERMAEELARLPSLAEQIGDNTTTAASATDYERALRQYWKTVTAGSKHVHQLASKAFAEGFYQDLAQARLGARDQQLLQLDPHFSPLHAPGLRCEKIRVRLGSDWVDLAGAFIFGQSTQPEVMLYWPETGLRSLVSRAALNAHLDAMAPPACLPLRYAAQWRGATPRNYQLQPITQSIFVDRVDAIVDLQQDNLAHVLSTASDDLTAAKVSVDDALDVRGLIDRRLRALDPALRWARHFINPQLLPPLIDPSFKPLLQGIDRLVWLANERDLVYRTSPGARAVAQRLLTPALAVFDANLEPDTTMLLSTAATSQGTPAARGTSLVQLLFQRVSGFSSSPITADDQVCRADLQRLPWFAASALEQILAGATQAFARRFDELLAGTENLSLCMDNHWLSVPGILRRNLENGLRLEMTLQRYFVTTPPALLDRLKQVLDKPLARQRQALGAQMVRAFGLQLNHLPGTPSVRLDLALLIDQPGAADHAVLFWSPIEGLKAYASLEQLGSELLMNLTTGEHRSAWLKLLPAGQHTAWIPLFEPALSVFLSVSTWAIPDDAINELQASIEHHQVTNAQRALQLATAGHFAPGIFEPFLDTPRKNDPISDYFEEQSYRFSDLHTREVLPDWLNLATTTDLAAFALLMQRSLDTLKPERSYLFGVPAIHGFANQHLRTRLDQDFTGQALDPDSIIINLKTFTAAPVSTGELPSGIPAATTQAEYSLTQAAMNHFSHDLGAVMTVRSAKGTPLPAGLNPEYIRKAIRELDLGGHYITLLTTELSPDNTQFAQRLARFSAMLGATLELAGFQHVLQDDWSRTALHYVSAIVQMPDGLARQAVGGQQIILSQLQLRAAADIAPDVVNGIYLIGPEAPDKGPLILFNAFTAENGLRVYNSRAELLAALQTDPQLQADILARLSGEAQRTYDNGGFAEPHLRWNTETSFDTFPETPGPAQLHIEAFTGNAFTLLLQDNIAYLLAIAKTQAVTSAQAKWNDFLNLMALGAEQASLFLPGKLAALAGLWQAKTWAGAATDAAANRQWGKALAEFAAALSSLAGGGATDGSAGEVLPTVTHGTELLGVVNPLRSYEVRNISLASLQKDLALPVYRSGQAAYAAVEGRVYRVFQQGEDWHIFTDAVRPGPKIRLDGERHWVLDQALGLRGGGTGSSKIDAFTSSAEDIDAEVDDRFTVTARGMTEIKAADRIKARQIRAAHALALRYLRVCLSNLDADRSKGFIPHTSDVILQGVFGFPATPTALTQRLRTMVSDVYVDLLSPSLSPKSSERFVTGSHKRSDSAVDAFVYSQDPLRRIFLAESFFSYVFPAHTTMEAQIGGFDARTHFQATVLIHELSHLRNKTTDIAYLSAAAPYVDLLSEQFPEVRAQILDDQNRGLSIHTPRSHLFKVNENGTLRDIKSEDGSALSNILRLTGTQTLEAARDVFYNDPIKRCDIILANADTLALVVTKLGRVPFHSTSV